MKQPMSLERMVASWMADAAATTAPSEQPLIDNILAATAQQRPRPRWLALLQESPMQAQAQVVVGSPNRRLLIAAALLLLAALAAVGIGAFLLQQPRPTASDDWPGFRGDAAHSGVVGNGPTGNPVVVWKTSVGAPIRGAVSILGDQAFVGSDDGALTAFDTTDGTKRWSFSGPAPMGGPYVIAGVVYDVDGAGVVHALKASDGTPLWASTVTIAGATDGVVSGGLLYYGSSDGYVIALDAKTGAQAWKTSVSPTPITMKFPTVADSLLVASDIHGFVSALDARTGEIRWAEQEPVDVPGTPVIADGSVYLGGAADATTGSLVSLKSSDGTLQWRIDRPLSAPSILGTTGYVTSHDGTLAAIELGTGKVEWEAHFPPGQLRTPALTDKVVYGYTDASHALFALDRATGGLLWSFELEGSNQCCIALSKGKVFVATDAGNVYAIGGDDAQLAVGKIPQTAPSAAPPTAAPTQAPVAELPAKVDWVATSGKTPFEPWSMASAPDGTLWVVNSTTGFDLFSRDGMYLESWGTAGSGDGQFDFARANGDPYGRIAFAKDGSFFVLDPGNHRIQAFTKDRRFLRAWGSLGSAPGMFIDPIDISVDAAGHVVVLDDKRGVIETYTPAGKVVRTIAAYPDAVQPNDGSNYLEIGPNGHFYLSMATPNDVIELDQDGKLVRVIGKGVFIEQAGAMGFDAAGRLYVTQGPQRDDQPGVVVFGPDGTLLGGFAPLGVGDGDLGFPGGMIVDASGIYVTDVGGLPDFGLRSAIRKFEPLAP